MNAALRHEEPDRVPVGEFYWGAFLEAVAERTRVARGRRSSMHTMILDWIVTTPNMDPHIRSSSTILKDTDEEVVVRTGFEAVVRKRFDMPMPECRVLGHGHDREAGSV